MQAGLAALPCGSPALALTPPLRPNFPIQLYHVSLCWENCVASQETSWKRRQGGLGLTGPARQFKA